MLASITIATHFDLPQIAAAAGQTDPERRWYEAGQLFVEGVEQATLEAAANAADPHHTLRRSQLDAINRAYETEFAPIKQQYPDSERESWPIQLSEAAALAEDPQAATPFLDALLVARGFGETKAELAAKVQAKNHAYAGLSASLTGKRHKLERQVLEALTVEEIAGIVWE